MAESKVVPLERSVPEPARGDATIPAGATVGWIARVDDQGIWVDAADDDAGPRLALSVVPLSRAELDAAAADRRDVVLMSVVGTGQPVLLGLCQPVPPVEAKLPADAEGIEASVDGDSRKLRIEGQDEVVLRCGKASITLRRNGRVVIRGVQVESRATGRNRIKGGAVLIN